MTPNCATIYRLGEIEVVPDRGIVLRDGQEIYLRPKTLHVLLYLIEHRRRLVTKEELMEAVWKDTAVTDDALVQSVGDIRKVLGDDAHNSRFIRTFPRAGYRFVGPVEETMPASVRLEEKVTTIEAEIEEEITEEQVDERAGQSMQAPFPEILRGPPRRHRRLLWTGAMIITVVVAGSLASWLWLFRHQAPQIAKPSLPPIPGRKAVAVMYLENQSNAAELAWLRHGLADMLITDLSRSKRLNILSRQQLSLLLERSGYLETPVLDLDRALDIGRRAGAEMIVMGGFAAIGTALRVDARLHDVSDGRLLAAESVTVERAEQILTRMGLLSIKLARQLDPQAMENGDGNGIAGVMTDNLEAYRYYSLALDKLSGVQIEQAINLLEKAIARDPDFAMAYGRLGYAYAMVWTQADKGRPYLEKAFRLSSRLTPKDRLSIIAWYAVANFDFEGAITTYRELLKQYPMEVEGYFRLGRLLSGEGQLEDAAATLAAGSALDPDSADILMESGRVLSLLGRHEDAIAASQRSVALKPREANAYDSLGLVCHAAGRYAGAIEAYRTAIELDSSFEPAVIHLGNTYYQLGRYREAIAQFERYLSLAPANAERGRAFGSLAWTYWHMGNNEKSETAAAKEAEMGSVVGAAVLVAVEKGQTPRALELANRFEPKSISDRGTRPPTRQHHYWLGRIALKDGHADEAIAQMRAALRQRALAWNIESLEDCLGDALLELGRLDEAIAEYLRVLRISPNLPHVHYSLSLSLERKGDRAAARVELSRFLEFWKDADPDAPLLLAARKRLSEL